MFATGSTGEPPNDKAEPPNDRDRPASSIRNRTWAVLLLGVLVGVAGTVLLPNLIAPILPDALRSAGESVRGTVADKKWKGDRLLLSIDAHRGAVLATFRKRTEELDLLIQEGDSVTLEVASTGPFADEPRLMQVKKFPRGPAGPATPGADSPADRTPEVDTGEAPEGPAETARPEASGVDTGAVPEGAGGGA